MLKSEHNNRYTDEQLISYLQIAKIRLGRVPTLTDVNDFDEFPTSGTFARRFGSWNNALKQAGFIPNVKQNYTKSELIELLKEKAKELGRTPKEREMKSKPGYPTSYTYSKHFGSWNNALKIAKLDIVQESEYTKQQLIENLINYSKELGRTPSVFDMKGQHPSIGPFSDKFGSWNNALLECGLKPNEGLFGNLWRKWERFCEEVATKKYGKIERQVGPGLNDSRPDIFIKSNNLFIDAMASAYISDFKKKQIRKFTKLGHDLEFWCLKHGQEFRDGKVKYIYLEDIENMLNQIGEIELSKKCKNFLKISEEDKKENLTYTDNNLIEYLIKLNKELGRTPGQRDMENKKGYPSAMTYAKRFGSWNNALKKAGIAHNVISEYSKIQLIKLLKKKASVLGRAPYQNEINADPEMSSTGPYFRVFGNWNKALEKAGLKSNYISFYSDTELIKFIKKLYKELGHIPNSLEMNNAKGYPASSVFKRAFGTYNKAVIYAGLKPAYRKIITNEELITCLKLLSSKSKRTPSQKDMNKEKGLPGSTTYIRRFGSWTNALKKASLEICGNRKWTDGELLDLLKKLSIELKRLPVRRDLEEDKSLPNIWTYKNRFGSWEQSLEKAGLHKTKGSERK